MSLFTDMCDRYHAAIAPALRSKVLSLLVRWLEEYWEDDWRHDPLLLMQLKEFIQKTKAVRRIVTAVTLC